MSVQSFTVKAQTSQTNFQTRSPIFIDGNANFTTSNGVTGGSGTAEDPYIIEGWDIQTAVDHGIHIQNTNVHFIIRNVSLHGEMASIHFGVFLENALNGVIRDSKLISNMNGIHSINSNNNVIINNNISENNHIGIHISGSDNTQILHNFIAFNVYGINLGSFHNVVSFNTILSSSHAITGGMNSTISYNNISRSKQTAILYLGSYNDVFSNYISGGLGINCWGDDYNNIHNNTFIRCFGGISLGWSEYDVPQYNNVFNNTIALSSQGIYLVGAVNNNIFDNIIISNDAGIYMLSSEGNNIYNNYLDNTMPLYNARDNGYNPWNASKKLGENIVGGPYIGGNYYIDYTGKDGNSDGFGDTPYAIPGGYSVDYMPLILYKHRFPIPTLLSVDYQESVELGDWINITITATNNGGTATWQTIHCGFPNCTSTENMEIVTHNLEGAKIYPTGSLLPAKYGETIKNSTYVIVEGVQGIWSYGEQHSMTVRIKPGKVGLFTLYVKTVSSVEYIPFFNQTETTDQQNEYVSIYTVRVVIPRVSIEVNNIESKPWSLLNIPFEDIDDARFYVLNFVKNGKPEAEFGAIPISITITNVGQRTAKNVEIDATITGVAALASLDEDNVKDDYVYPHPFEYEHSYSVGTINAMSTKNVTMEIPVKYAHVFTGVFKYNEEDEADILFIATELKVDLEIGGANTNKIQESITLTGVANPLELAAYTILGVLERLKDKMTDELYQQMREYVYVISGGMAIQSFPITTDTHTINTQIKPGTTSFSISAFIPFGIELVELTVTVGMFTLGIITTAAVNGFAFLIIKPPDLRYGDAQITIKTKETTALVLVMRDSFKPFNLTTIEILSENISFYHKITFENKSYNLHFNSNCTVFDIKFNDTERMISFEMAGQESTVGFCNVTIPKELLRANATHPWKVKLNDSNRSFASTENATHSFVYFDITGTGTYTIEIIGAEVIPEFPTWIVLPLLMILVMLAMILRKKQKKT